MASSDAELQEFAYWRFESGDLLVNSVDMRCMDLWPHYVKEMWIKLANRNGLGWKVGIFLIALQVVNFHVGATSTVALHGMLGTIVK